MSDISQKQLEANRNNAKLGGVKTDEGKEVSKYNALKHGLLSKEVLLDDDEKDILAEFSERIYTELKPVGVLEKLLTDRIVANMWRLRRLLKVETATMEWEKYFELKLSLNIDTPREQTERKAMRDMIANKEIEKMLRYEASIERGIFRALHELQRIQNARSGEGPPSSVAVDIDVSKE